MTNHIELEFPPCPLCYSERRETSYGQFGEHKIMRCQDCQAHYLYPRLTESAMRRFYTNDNYFEGGDSGYSDTSYADQEGALSSTFKRLMRNLHKRKLTGGSLLEVGCGYGYLLEEANEYFSHRVGTDFSPQGVRLASAKADEVYEGGIEQIPVAAKFDCVIATHVIEHVYQPLEFVKQLISHTEPSGTVILAAPDMGGMLRKVMGHRWPSFKIPEHVVYFDAVTLSALMRRAGLIDIEELPYPHAFPLALIASKLRLPFPAALGKANIWVPATTVALYGRVPDE
ncbi:MAG: class I SAM-dependent methyltransferase [Acidobacteria bacterium]|jgi:SAM-dependent methyltransferase|nr:class I SAM-dependent methyltransferase [Acidobacteriota bacterium]